MLWTQLEQSLLLLWTSGIVIVGVAQLAQVAHLVLWRFSCRDLAIAIIVVTSAGYNTGNESMRAAGYFNTTSAIDAVQFKPAAGTIDSGTITLYGIN